MVRDRVEAAVWGVIVGNTIGAPLRKKSNFTKLAFYEPVPQRMAPSFALEAWLLYARHLQSGLDPTKLTSTLCDGTVGGSLQMAFARSNYSRGLLAPASGSYSNPVASGCGGLDRSLIWGLLFPAQPEVAARWASFDASIDHADDGVWCPIALSAAVAQIETGCSFAQLVGFLTARLPAQSLAHKGISLVLQTLGTGDAVKTVLSKLPTTIGTEDSNHAVFVLTLALASIANSSDVAGAVSVAAGCGGASSECATVAGVLASLMFGPVTDDWKAPLGEAFVSGHLSAQKECPGTIHELIDIISGAVHELPVPVEISEPNEPTEPNEPVAETSFDPTGETPPPIPMEEPQAEPAVEAQIEPELIPVSEPVVVLPVAPTGSTQCWIKGDLQVELTYLNSPCAAFGKPLQLGITIRNLGDQPNDVAGALSSPDGWQTNTRMETSRIEAGKPVTHAAIVQVPEFNIDTALTLTIDGMDFKVPVLCPNTWFFAGPFPNDDDMAFTKETPAERSQKASDRFSGRSGMAVKWETLHAYSDTIDVEPLFASGPGSVIVFGRFHFAKPTKTTVVAVSAPGVVVKANGNNVLRYKDAHVPVTKLDAPYTGIFDASDEVTISIKLIRDKAPMAPLTLFFLDDQGRIVRPLSLRSMPE